MQPLVQLPLATEQVQQSPWKREAPQQAAEGEKALQALSARSFTAVVEATVGPDQLPVGILPGQRHS